jgi:hypothetical protein
MDDFRKLITDEEARYHPDIAAIQVHALTSIMRDLVQEGPPPDSDSKACLRHNTMVSTLAHITELHAAALYRWVTEHLDLFHPDD